MCNIRTIYYMRNIKNNFYQYLECFPFFFRTSSMRFAMLYTNDFAISNVTDLHLCCKSVLSSFIFVSFWWSKRFLRIAHKFSIMFRSGEFPGQGPKILMFFFSRNSLILLALWQGAPSCWKIQFPAWTVH